MRLFLLFIAVLFCGAVFAQPIRLHQLEKLPVQKYEAAKLYALNDLVARDGVIWRALDDDVSDPVAGVEWERVIAVEADTIALGALADSMSTITKIPLYDLTSNSQFRGGTGVRTIHVVGTSKIETGNLGFDQMREEISTALGERVYPGNVHIRTDINKNQFLTTSLTGSWTWDRSSNKTLSGFELIGQAGATTRIAFNQGLAYATPQVTYLFVEGGGGTIAFNANELGQATFATQTLNTSALSGIHVLTLNTPSPVYSANAALEYNISISGAAVRIVGMYATGSDLWTISNHGVFGWSTAEHLAMYENPAYATEYAVTLPDLVIFAHGTNDASSDIAAADYGENTREWVDRFRTITSDAASIVISTGSTLDAAGLGDRDLRARRIDTLGRQISVEKRTGFLSEYQLFGDNLGVLVDGTHYTPEAGEAVGNLFAKAGLDVIRQARTPWSYEQQAFDQNRRIFKNANIPTDRVVIGSSDYTTFGQGRMNYAFGVADFTQRYYSSTYTTWNSDFNLLAADRYMLYKASGYSAADQVLQDFTWAQKSLQFWPRTNASTIRFDFETHSLQSPSANKFGPFRVTDGGGKSAMFTLYNGNTLAHPGTMWSSTGDVSAGDAKIGKLQNTQEGYRKLNGTGYIVLEFPTLTRSYEFIVGELTILRTGTVNGNHLQRESMKETIKFQTYHINGASASYNPNVIFEGNAQMGGYTKVARIIKDAGSAKTYIVIGEGTDTYSNNYWAALENLYFGEDSSPEIYTGEFSIYVSATLPAGTVRFYESNTDTDRIEALIAAGGDNLGNHTATQDIIMGANRLRNAVASANSIELTTTGVFLGTTSGNWLFRDELQMPVNTTTPTSTAGQFYWKTITENGFFRSRPYFYSDRDRLTSDGISTLTEARIITEQDFNLPIRAHKDADEVYTSGGVESEFTVSGLASGRYKVTYYFRIRSNTAGGGIDWFPNTTNYSSTGSAFVFARDADGLETEWSVGDVQNAGGGAANTWSVVKYEGLMNFTGAGTVSISLGPNGLGNLTIGAGSYVEYVKIAN